MVILIVENELLLAAQLKTFLQEAVPGAVFLPPATSVAETVQLLNIHHPDLIFMDVELTDGNAFAVFRDATVNAPVIFTTGFDRYVMNAFEHNGIDYLLKPLSPEKVKRAMDNYRARKNMFIATALGPDWSLLLDQRPKTFRNKFLVKQGQKLIPVPTSGINHFYSEHTLTWLVTKDKRKFVIPESLHELEQVLHPDEFFRLSRKYLVAKSAIYLLDTHSPGQVTVFVNQLEEETVVVSRQQTPALKEWLLR